MRNRRSFLRITYKKTRQCGANTDGQAATGEDKTGATGMDQHRATIRVAVVPMLMIFFAETGRSVPAGIASNVAAVVFHVFGCIASVSICYRIAQIEQIPWAFLTLDYCFAFEVANRV